MRRLVTISYTGLDAGGGVPKFNRNLHTAFPDRQCVHFCWEHFPWQREVDARGETEWGRARMLNEHLARTRLITSDDVVVADGFWASGLEHFPLAVSHSHGIWSHLTQEDVLAGKQPDMPAHHAAQVQFRYRWTQQGKHLTAVSSFIADQMRLQWGFVVDRVINNGVDTELHRPRTGCFDGIDRPLMVHGVNDPSNANKGWDHIELLKEEAHAGRLDAVILSLDEAHAWFEKLSGRSWLKSYVLAQADLVVHPSGYEGNSLFVAETLACGIPIVGYDVGYLWSIKDELGFVLDRNKRDPEYTLYGVMTLLSLCEQFPDLRLPYRGFAIRDLSIERFNSSWRSYVEEIENA